MKTGKYVVVDVEKANNSHSSICQIGLVVFENGVQTQVFESLVNPLSEFNPIHINIHGIKADDVINAPTMSDLQDQLSNYFDQAVICSYGTSDKFALDCYFDVGAMRWVDVSKEVRHAIPEFKKGGHKLSNVIQHIGLELPPGEFHNALVDAKAALDILRYCVDVKNIKLQTFMNNGNLSLL